MAVVSRMSEENKNEETVVEEKAEEKVGKKGPQLLVRFQEDAQVGTDDGYISWRPGVDAGVQVSPRPDPKIVPGYLRIVKKWVEDYPSLKTEGREGNERVRANRHTMESWGKLTDMFKNYYGDLLYYLHPTLTTVIETTILVRSLLNQQPARKGFLRRR